MATTPDPLAIDALRAWIGREETAEDRVTAAFARRYAATFDLPADAIADGCALPPLAHFGLAPTIAATADLAPDGHPRKGGFLPPVPLPRRMWAAGALVFHDDLHVGAAVRRRSRIADVALKSGASGPLCFVTVEHELAADGAPAIAETQTIVYRGAGAGPAGGTPVPAPAGAIRRRLEPTPMLLFRYSALTFNAHRIHYDRRYAVEAEAYPGLVVHGPLQAALLVNLATEIHGRPPARFTFRSRAPLFDTAPIVLHAGPDGAGLSLWTAREDGPVAMEARADWS